MSTSQTRRSIDRRLAITPVAVLGGCLVVIVSACIGPWPHKSSTQVRETDFDRGVHLLEQAGVEGVSIGGGRSLEDSREYLRLVAELQGSKRDLLIAAVDAFEKAAQAEPSNYRIYANSAIALIFLRRPEQAVAKLDRAIELCPREGNDLEELAFIRAVFLGELADSAPLGGEPDINNLERALAAYDFVLNVNPHKYEARYNRANLCDALGRYQDAVDDYDRILETRPQDPNCYIAKALTLRSAQRYQEAIAVIDHLLKISPNHYGANRLRKELVALQSWGR